MNVYKDATIATLFMLGTVIALILLCTSLSKSKLKPNAQPTVTPMNWEIVESPNSTTHVYRARTTGGYIYKVGRDSFFVPNEGVENSND